jgi:hypothetical protein
MNKLQTELSRLYLTHDAPSDGQDSTETAFSLINAKGQVRAMVIEVAQQANLEGVASLWQGVQADLGLPAPTIAVSGIDGCQVWFSLVEPVPIAVAQDFLESLRLRYLSDIAPRHIRMKPVSDASAETSEQHARMVPALQAATGHWSAFVAPGLISMFADEPWLDMPPNPDAQANLLSSFESMKSADFRQAQARLHSPIAPVFPASRDTEGAPPDSTGRENAQPGARPASEHEALKPKHFLLSVMNDPAIALHLRIEAAKALLPFFEGECSR